MRPGVYDCRRGTDVIRVIVVRQLPEAEHNAPLHLFSASAEQVTHAAARYQQHSEQTSTLLYRLFEGYQQEGLAMPYTMDDFVRDFVKEHLKDLSPEERLKGLPPEERLAGLSPEEIERALKKLKAEGAPRAPRRRKNGPKA